MGRLLNLIFDVFLGLLLGALVLITVGGVFMRYVMSSPWHWTEELSGLLMAWIVFIGVYNAERDRENLTIDFFVQIFNKHTRKLIAIIITLVSVFLLFLTAYWGWGQAEAVQLRKTRIMGISLFWLYLPVVIGFSATALLLLRRLAKGADDN